MARRETRPGVTLNCPADCAVRGNKNRPRAKRERIIEFFDGPTQQGGLVSFLRLDDGSLRVEVYRVSEKVTVIAPRVGKGE